MNQNGSQPAELVHYGVKGMKWGVRRAEKNAANSSYTQGMRSKDTRLYGAGGVKRINRRMNKGIDATKARKKERAFQRRRTAAVVSGIILAKNARNVGLILKAIGHLTAGSVAQRADTKRGEAFARNAFSDERGLRGTPKTSRQSRDGSYKIRSF